MMVVPAAGATAAAAVRALPPLGAVMGPPILRHRWRPPSHSPYLWPLWYVSSIGPRQRHVPTAVAAATWGGGRRAVSGRQRGVILMLEDACACAPYAPDPFIMCPWCVSDHQQGAQLHTALLWALLLLLVALR